MEDVFVLYIVDYNDSDKNMILRNKYDENSDWDVLTKGTLNEDDRKKLLTVFMNNLNNITEESIELLEKNQGAIEFIDPNETLNTLIAFNRERLDDGNPNYKYVEMIQSLYLVLYIQ